MAWIKETNPKNWTHVAEDDYAAYCKEQGLSETEYTTMELLAIAAARQCYDYTFIFAGTGLPMIGCMMAQHTYAPHAMIIMEAGILDPKLLEVPISVSEARGGYQCCTLSNMADTFGTFALRGFCTFGMLGGAECDRYGNLNSTAVGGYYSGSASETGKGPKVRFAGSGGANPIASFSDLGLVLMVHEKRRFPEKVTYLTSPTGSRGAVGSNEDRWHYGLFRGGPTTIITDLCVLKSDEKTGELLLAEVFPGIDEETVHENTGWDLKRHPDFRPFDPPHREELAIVRCICDPHRIYLGRKTKRELAATKD